MDTVSIENLFVPWRFNLAGTSECGAGGLESDLEAFSFTFGDVHFTFGDVHFTFEDVHFTFGDVHFTFRDVHFTFGDVHFTLSPVN